MEEIKNIIKNYEELIVYSLISVFIGAIVALIEVAFGKGITFFTNLRLTLFPWILLGLPFAGLVIIYAFEHWGPISKKGMNLVFEVDQGLSNWIPLRLVPFMIGSTWITHLFGGSSGREGVAVQIGATVSHFVGRRFHNKDTSVIFLVAGMAAGFAGLFGTPITAVFFSIEVLVAGTLKYRAMGPAIASAFTAASISSLFGISKSSFLLNYDFELNLFLFLRLVVLGILFGFIGGAFAWCLEGAKDYFKKIIESPYKRIFYGGIILAILIYVCYQGRYSGHGEALIEAVMHSEMIYSWDWLLKFALTILTLSIGFQGGEVTPLFSIGTLLGCVMAPYFGIPTELCAALGYAAVFGGGTNTFLAPIAIGMEIFGYHNFPLFFIVCSIAYLVNRNQSIYSLQKREGL